MKHLLLTLSFCFMVQLASAQNKNIIRTGDKTFSVGTYANPFRFERALQASLYWDWAACLEMCLNYAGLNVSQEQVMTLVNGPVDNPLSTPQDLIFAINKNTPPAWGKPSKVFTTNAAIDADVLFDELSANRPLILGAATGGAEGHALIVTAMSYNIKFDANGQQIGITPNNVTLRDPWPTALANRTINWPDFINLTAALYTLKVEFKETK